MSCIKNCFCKAGFIDIVEADNGDASSLPHQDQLRADLWSCIVDAELAKPDVGWNELVHADNDTGIAEPRTDVGIVRKDQAHCDDQESDDEDDESMEPALATMSVSTTSYPSNNLYAVGHLTVSTCVIYTSWRAL